jgi:hypothetical protein
MYTHESDMRGAIEDAEATAPQSFNTFRPCLARVAESSIDPKKISGGES